MLPWAGRRLGRHARSAEAERAAEGLPPSRQGLHHAPGLEVRMPQGLVQPQDRRHAGRAIREQRVPVGERPGAEHGREFAAHTFLGGGVATAVQGRQIGPLNALAQRQPELALQGADRHEPPVRRGIGGIAGQAAGERALAHGRHAALLVQRGERQHRVGQHAIGDRDVQVATAARAGRVEQGRQNASHRRHGAAQQVGDGQVGQAGPGG